jgi:RNA polymerase sigma factor (TIGR02999 family)
VTRDNAEPGKKGPGEVTRLLARWTAGDPVALEALTPIVYAELRRIAESYLRRERPTHTLQPTALVHEAWMRLARQEELTFEHRKQFYGLAARIMRSILVDHARALRAEKRGGKVEKTTLEDAGQPDRTEQLLALDEALDRLAGMSERQAKVIELHYFGGLTLEEMSDLLRVSPPTLSRDKKMAEAWLGHTLAGIFD